MRKSKKIDSIEFQYKRRCEQFLYKHIFNELFGAKIIRLERTTFEARLIPLHKQQTNNTLLRYHRLSAE